MNRDELAKVIHRALGDFTGIYDTTDEEDREMAGAIIEWFEAQTAEELDALPKCEHINTWFDRTFCEACDAMHTVCEDCGEDDCEEVK